MKYPTVSSVFDLGDGNGRQSHGKMMSFSVLTCAVVYAFTHLLTVEGVAFWGLLVSASYGIPGLKLWLGARNGRTSRGPEGATNGVQS